MKPTSFTLPLLESECIAIEYPAIVKNTDKALATMGGSDAINKILNSNGRRPLLLKFRPNIPSAKTAFATVHPAHIIFMNVRQLRHKRTGEVRLSVQVIGTCNQLYTFDGMFDFQYCQIQRQYNGCDENPSYQPLCPVPQGVYDINLVEYFETHKNDPLFILPRYFTRSDQGFELNMNENRSGAEDISTHEDKSRILGSVSRKARNKHAILLRNYQTVPKEPLPEAMERLKSMPYLEPIYLRLKELFHLSPVWSKRALIAKMKQNPKDLRYYSECLAMVAYYVHNGPWRRSWLRLGFDPNDPTNAPVARLFQIVEIKIKFTEIDEGTLQMFGNLIPSNLTKPKFDEDLHIYVTGRLPYAFDAFYHLKDIQHEPVQTLIAECSIPSKSQPEDGWFREGFIQEVRQILNADIEAVVEKYVKLGSNASVSNAQEAHSSSLAVRQNKNIRMMNDSSDASADMDDPEYDPEDDEDCDLSDFDAFD